MGRSRHPMREAVKNKYIESCGKAETSELAAFAGVTPTKIRQWKSADKWNELLTQLMKPKRGGQYGNKNAAGHGAPLGNTNAEKHGAYSEPRISNMTKAELDEIDNITLDTKSNLLSELKMLEMKRIDLERRIAALDDDENELYVDKVITAPAGITEISSSRFQRRAALETAYNRIHGRIIKLLDSIRNYECESEKLKIERKKLKLAEQKVSGIYEIEGFDEESALEKMIENAVSEGSE